MKIELAFEIMGKYFISPKEIQNYFGVKFTPQQLKNLNNIRFSEATLEKCSDTHILFPNPLNSIIEINNYCNKIGKHNLFYDNNEIDYGKEMFANEKGECQWILFPKTLSNEIEKDENAQSAQLNVCAITSYYFATGGERLLQNVYRRTSSKDSFGQYIYVGCFGPDGFSIKPMERD